MYIIWVWMNWYFYYGTVIANCLGSYLFHVSGSTLLPKHRQQLNEDFFLAFIDFMLPSSCFGVSGFVLSASWFSNFPFWSTSVVWYRWLMEVSSSAASVEKYSISTKTFHDAILELNTQRHWIRWLSQNLIYAIIDRVCLRILNNALGNALFSWGTQFTCYRLCIVF